MASPELAFPNPVAALDSPDPLAAAQAVRDHTAHLRDGTLSLPEAQSFVAKLISLSTHENARIRQAVAESLPHLPEPVFDQLLAHFRTDSNRYVRDAAEESERQRSTKRRLAAEGAEADQRVARWYREIDQKGLRLTAQRIASYEREYFIRRMCHEAGAAYIPHADAVTKLRALADGPEIDRAELRALANRIEERFAFVQHVLSEGRKHADVVEPSFRSENLRALVADEAALAASKHPDRAARIAIDVSGVDPSIVLDADAGFLRQAFGNILKNAVEAYDEHASDAPIAIRVIASVVGAGHQVVLAFADRGKGMGADERANAFVPFASKKAGGTGFGLFITQRVARNIHGGELVIESEVGKGTTVTMTLPLKQELSKAKTTKATRARKTR